MADILRRGIESASEIHYNDFISKLKTSRKDNPHGSTINAAEMALDKALGELLELRMTTPQNYKRERDIEAHLKLQLTSPETLDRLRQIIGNMSSQVLTAVGVAVQGENGGRAPVTSSAGEDEPNSL